MRLVAGFIQVFSGLKAPLRQWPLLQIKERNFENRVGLVQVRPVNHGGAQYERIVYRGVSVDIAADELDQGQVGKWFLRQGLNQPDSFSGTADLCVL